MRLEQLPPPAQGVDIIRRSLPQPAQKNHFVVRALPTASYEEEHVEISAPHPVYVGSLKSIFAGDLLHTATPTGWNYLLFNRARVRRTPVLTAYLPADILSEEAGQWQHAQISQSTFGPNFLKAMRRAEKLRPRSEEVFEVRVLEIPALYSISVWFYGKQNLFMALPPTPQGMRPFVLMTEEEFVGLLRQNAEQQAVAAPITPSMEPETD